MDERVIYYLGGPADLTKQVWRNVVLGDRIRFAVAEPVNVVPYEPEKPPPPTFHSALYRVAGPVDRNVYVAVFERMEEL